MSTKNILFLAVGIIITLIVFSLIKCRSTGHLVEEKNPASDTKTIYQSDQNFRDSMEQMSRHELWASANNEIDEKATFSDYPELPYYFKDKRTGLCFAVYKNFGFEKVPCGHLKDVL